MLRTEALFRIRPRWTRSVQSVAARICDAYVARIRARSWPCAGFFMDSATDSGFIVRTCPDNPILSFLGGAKLFLCTVAFGINIRAAGKVGFPVPVSNTGNRNSSEIRPVMQLLNAS
jgi:hypothetical protein